MTTTAEQVEQEQEEYERERAGDAQRDAEEEESAAREEAAEAEPLEPIGPDELRKAENAISAQRKKLAGILGESYVAHDCPMCSSLGFVPELPPPGTEFALVPDEDGAPVLMAKPPLAEELQQAPDKGPCPECAALGSVKTGSKNPNAQVAPCSKCSGNGWVTIAREATQYAPPPPLDGLGAVPPPAPPPGVGIDAWGRPAGHQHWGVPPAQIPG